MQLVATESGADDHAAKRRRVELVPALEKELYPISSLRRKSGLLGPTMLIKGHASAVYCLDFSPDGRILASGSNDKNIFIWNVYGECENTAVLSGHSSAVLELHFSADGEQLYTCSADKSCAIWDVEWQASEEVERPYCHRQLRCAISQGTSASRFRRR
jgi:Prp8 binding protein